MNQTNQQPIELISFNLCPFVQRSVITLLKKGVDFKITYIDLANKPDWFLKISPLGKVPVLRYGDEVLFESAVINEFLDEITPDPLLPSLPLEKAKQRAWVEFSSGALVDQYLMSAAKTEDDFKKHSEALNSKLTRLNELIESDFFAGKEFTLIDSAIAPLFTRFQVMAEKLDHDFVEHFDKLKLYAAKVLSLDFVKGSVLSNFDDLYLAYLDKNQSYLLAK
ncbi:MAG: glutathione S-transferase family protein [Kangiellaceae bacterium]|nr:glutathione S-transferase family protein [Kangiellaceae bacterium]MCW8998709.1 glutathione S-transferase family protein [Kangiellaceae bacterium]